MVNYCCVSGCGRNSRSSKQLNYYGIPKERSRQIEWFQAAGREDLIEKSQERLGLSYRFCSRHFEPTSVKNKHLKPDAVPTLHLPGSRNEDDSDSNEDLQHEDIVCNNCRSPIVGYRYKCLTCPDYDLCSICETVETHAEHYMLRIPRPAQDEMTDKLLSKWINLVRNEGPGDVSSDDEPITKYVRNYDSGVDLSEDLKDKIRKEVTRALSSTKKKKVKTAKKREAETNRFGRRQRQKTDCESERKGCPEMVFVAGHALDVKAEQGVQPLVIPDTSMDQGQPLVHVKISEDFSDLMIEIPGRQDMF